MALIAHTIAGSADGNTVTTSAIDTTGADLIRVSVSGYDSTLPVTDSYGNTWSVGNNVGVGFFASIQYFYALAPTVGSGHTFTCNPGASGKRPSIAVQAWAGVTAWDSHGTVNGSTVTTYETAALTPTTIGDLLFSDLCVENTDTVTIDSDWTILGQIPYSVGLHAALAHAYAFAPSTSPIDADWAWTTSTGTKGGIISAFEYVEPPTTKRVGIIGKNGTTTCDVGVLLNLDDVTRTMAQEKALGLGGNLVLYEQASAPPAVANAAVLYAVDSGAGKTKLMCLMPSGAAIQLAIEP